MTSIAMHAAPSVRSPGRFARLREWWMTRRALKIAERVGLPWSEPEAVEPDPEPEHEHRMRSSAPPLGSGGSWPTIPPPHPPQPHPQPQPVHPPFAHQPAQHTHVAIRMQRVLVEASWDPNLTPKKLWNAMGPLAAELQGLAAQEEDQERRMARNQQVAVAQTVLLEDATLRGVPDEVAVEQAKSGIIGRAVHVAAEERTAVMEPITEDTPDPRTVSVPRDVNPGDVEAPPEESPVHDPADPMPLPMPTQEFVAGADPEPAKPKPKPRRSPRTKPAVAVVVQEAGAAP